MLQLIGLQRRKIDFENLNGVMKLKRFCRTCKELILNLWSCISSFNFSIILIFRCVKPILTASFLKFCLLKIIVRPYISVMTKFEVNNVLKIKLKHFENDMQFWGDICNALTR